MALRPYQPPRPPRRFDIVAFDSHDRPALIVEIKRNADIRDRKQFLTDTISYVEESGRPAPFFLIANEDTIALYRKDTDSATWPEVAEFDTASVLRNYDREYGKNPVYEHYLASLIQVWLNDIADNWHSKAPPKADLFEQFGLIDALREGSLAVDASL